MSVHRESDVNLLGVFTYIRDEEEAIRLLQEKGILHWERCCSCGQLMTLAASTTGRSSPVEMPQGNVQDRGSLAQRDAGQVPQIGVRRDSDDSRYCAVQCKRIDLNSHPRVDEEEQEAQACRAAPEAQPIAAEQRFHEDYSEEQVAEPSLSVLRRSTRVRRQRNCLCGVRQGMS
uniref:Uncharacterized protein n=1 Tax=Trichuris muris TaxID=70415 RepID=A0A5S6QM20_TRIMR